MAMQGLGNEMFEEMGKGLVLSHSYTTFLIKTAPLPLLLLAGICIPPFGWSKLSAPELSMVLQPNSNQTWYLSIYFYN